MRIFHHLGIISANLDLAMKTFSLENSDLIDSVTDEVQKNNLYFFSTGNSNVFIEIVVPYSELSTTFNFVNKRGTSLHHVAFLVDNLEAEIENKLLSKGAILVGRFSLEIAVFGGKIKTAFIFSDNNLIEYLELE